MGQKIWYICLSTITCLCLILFICSATIEKATEGKTFGSIEEIPRNRVGLIIGTSNRLVGGRSNPYYTNRVDAAITLFKAGKIDYILVSGDNSSPYYNEPIVFKRDLIKGGIPEERIFLDYAG